MRKHDERQMGALTAAGLALLLAGCSGWSFDPPLRGNPNVERFNVPRVQAAAPASPTTFAQALTTDYAGFAVALRDDHKDWADADYFARKGLAASRGEMVPPENNRNWLIPLEVPEQFRSELANGRARLVAAIEKGGAERLPLVAARAQVSYDCWVERMEDDWKNAINGPCRQQFLDALARLEGAPQGAAQPATGPGLGREYRVYFEFDRAEILPEAAQILQQVATSAKQDPKIGVVLVGKADRAGSDQYNMRLSQRRADAVRDALIRDGVPRDRIETRWVGEREPPVPTPDNVREPRNRVVEINLR
jgi:OOP family OmpA-OmpF porin